MEMGHPFPAWRLFPAGQIRNRVLLLPALRQPMPQDLKYFSFDRNISKYLSLQTPKMAFHMDWTLSLPAPSLVLPTPAGPEALSPSPAASSHQGGPREGPTVWPQESVPQHIPSSEQQGPTHA